MDLSYSIYGTGEPIVLIHSGGVDSRAWGELVPLLARTHEVVTFDARGTGRSPAPQVPLNLVEDLRQLLDDLKLEQVTLVGHSIGGELATNFTLSSPDRVARLIAVAPSLTGFIFSETYRGWIQQLNSLAPDVSKMIQFSLQGPIYRTVMASGQRDIFIDMHTQYFTRVFTEWRSFEVIWPQPRAIEQLEEIAVPTLFMYGTVEWDDMRMIAEEFKRIPRIAFVEIEGADHMLPLTHPQEMAPHILSFLEAADKS
ncbi:alpha/beta fold hydrolase [Paenibacillus alvei]|uniref:alpha/beta fold hydrolase n=1 Tax=Paenibacillus alvei TaxID=44250 RepID=UPI00038639AE|nr:alpha/beta hydrolase [Paenibacillus alvei]EPY13430.1 alpha/beta hydrolase fold protein [Paenibacillus alvei A6-6i-x]